jgi:DNA polymerase III epsilon subunit-like protein
MKILVFDTETTGLPPKTKSMRMEDLDYWPHVVQFSYIVYDTESHSIIKLKDSIIKIPINMCQEVIDIHGITNEMSQSSTCYIENVLEEFCYDFEDVDIVVAHNMSFDLNMIKIELMRLTMRENDDAEVFKSILKSVNSTKQNVYCTMANSTELLNLKMRSKFGTYFTKFPKLSELHYHLFGVVPRNLHNSMNDVLICLRCYYKLTKNIDIRDESLEIRDLTMNLI